MSSIGSIGAEQVFNVFISSPTDVSAERAVADSVLEQLNAEFAGRYRFRDIDWEKEEHKYYTASSDFQSQIRKPSDCDIVICILWTRLGTELTAPYARPDGSARTGTEYEFEDALDHAVVHDMPDILVYRKTRLEGWEIDPMKFDPQKIEDNQRQMRALDAFWLRWFRNEKGQFTAAFETFESTADFADKLKRQLRIWLDRRFKRTTWSITIQGSPYLSLESFDACYADVFFGRRRATRQVIARLITRSLDGCAFLVVVGMSGAGKSSLVKAGVAPWLEGGRVAAHVEAGRAVDAWRTCVVRCDLLLEDPMLQLAKALFDPDCLPELAEGDYARPEELAKLMQTAPSSAVVPVKSALRRAGESIRKHKRFDREVIANLVIVFDQLEAVLLGPVASRDPVVALMDALARSGPVAVIATMRSDFYPEFQTNPVLMKLKTDAGDNGVFDLAPPNGHEILEIIKGPAEAAGLALQQDGELDLAMMLSDAAAKPGSLPLLEFTLARLFEERDQVTNTLLIDTYKHLGGLEGAIAVEAERLVAGMPDPLQAALSELFLRLVEVDESKGAIAASAHTLPRRTLTDPNQIEAADRLVQGRFLIAAHSDAGPSLRLAHEALLLHWPRLSKLIASETDFLATRRRLQREAVVWEREDRHHDFLMPHGRRLKKAEELLQKRASLLDPETITFIRTSLTVARRDQRRRWLTRSITTTAAIVAVAVCGTVIVNQRRAERIAVANGAADMLLAHSRYSEVIPLAVAALPRQVNSSSTVSVQELVAKLRFALLRNRLEVAIGGFRKSPTQIAFDSTGSKLLASSDQGDIGVWDTSNGTSLVAYKDRMAVCCAMFDPSGTHVLFATTGGGIQTLDLASSTVKSLTPTGTKITALSIDPSGVLLITGAAAGALQAWNARDLSEPPRNLATRGSVGTIAWCPRDRWFVVVSDQGDMRLFSYDGTQLAGRSIGGTGPFRTAVDAHCDRTVVAAEREHTLWVWNSINPSNPIQAIAPIKTGRAVDSMALDPQGHWLVTGSRDDEIAKLWNIDNATPAVELHNNGRVQDLAFSSDGSRIASAAFDDWAQLWDVRSGKQLPDFVLRDGAAFNRRVVFASDGTRLATLAGVQDAREPAIRIWNVGDRSEAGDAAGLGLIAVGAPVRRVVFSQQYIATAGEDGHVHLWDAHTLHTADGGPIERDDIIFDVEFDASGKRLATGAADGSTVVWDLENQHAHVMLPILSPKDGLHVWATELSFDPVHPRVVASFADPVEHRGGSRIYNLATGTSGPTLLSQDKREVWSAVFDGSGEHVLSASEDRTASIWDATGGQLLKTFAGGHTKAVNWAGFSHAGDKAITVSDDGTARLWSVATGQPIGGPLINDPTGLVEMAAFSLDDATVVTSTSTGRLYYWDVSSQDLLGIQMLNDGDAILNCVNYDDHDLGGGRLAVGSHDGTVQVLDGRAVLNPMPMLDRARQLALRLRPEVVN